MILESKIWDIKIMRSFFIIGCQKTCAKLTTYTYFLNEIEQRKQRLSRAFESSYSEIIWKIL